MATPEMLQPAVQLVELEHNNHHLNQINKLGIKQDVLSIFGKKYKPKIIISTPTLAGTGPAAAPGGPEPRPYSCMFCPAAFKTETALVNHVRVHVGAAGIQSGVNGTAPPPPPGSCKQIVHSCLYCNRSFKQATNLEIHVRTYHPYGDGTNGQHINYNQAGINAAYMMNQAGLALWEYKNQEQQQAQEVNIKEEIGEGNNNQPGQNSHPDIKMEKSEDGTVAQQWEKISSKDIQAYQLERPHRCVYCIKSFKQAAHLKQHLRIHNDERPYECTYCARRFRQKAVLDQHVRLHTGEKPYVCVQCGNTFRQLTNLKSHLNTCTGQAPSYLVSHSIWGKNIENDGPASGRPRRGRKSTPQNQYIKLSEGMCANKKVADWLKSEATIHRFDPDHNLQGQTSPSQGHISHDDEGQRSDTPSNPVTSSRSLWSKAMSLDTASKSLQHHWNNSGGAKDLGHTISGVALWEHNKAMQQQQQSQQETNENS